jgi:valyl-tRNA synthetase
MFFQKKDTLKPETTPNKINIINKLTMYDFKIIEKKWQDFWKKNKTFRTPSPNETTPS